MSDRSSPVNVAIGWLLVVFGGLWLALTGGCTAVFVVSSVMEMARGHYGGNGSAIGPFLLVGAFCIAPGVAMLWLGLRMVKRRGGPKSS